MNVTDVTGERQVSAFGAGAPAGMGQDEFLRMLVVQLQNQDPLNPMDSQNFSAQLAQFSSLEQLIKMNNQLGDIGISQNIQNNAQTVGMIGKDVVASSDLVTIGEAGSSEIRFQLEARASETTVSIFDANGGLVRTLDVGESPAGSNQIVWDGNDSSGVRVAPGVYRLQVSGVDRAGSRVGATTSVSGRVTGVTFENGTPELLMGDLRVSLGDVISIRLAEGET